MIVPLCRIIYVANSCIRDLEEGARLTTKLMPSQQQQIQSNLAHQISGVRHFLDKILDEKRTIDSGRRSKKTDR